MTRRAGWLRRSRAGALVALIAGIAALLFWMRPGRLEDWQEFGFDWLVRLVPITREFGANPPVLVVDIGATDEAGVNWDRSASARLAARLAEASPKVVAWDIVFAGSCDDALPNVALAAGLSRTTTVLGFLMSSSGGGEGAGDQAALAVEQDLLPELWSAPGAELPCPLFEAAVGGVGAVSLPGDGSARVRMAPAAVVVGGTPMPGLSIEALRLGLELPTPVLAADRLHLGATSVPLGPAGMIRFKPTPAMQRADRTISAEAVLKSEEGSRIAGAIVFVGSSLPQRGGLRHTSESPLYPSVQIAADVTEGLLGGRLPYRTTGAAGAEAGVLLIGGALAAAAVLLLPPFAALAVALALSASWFAAAAWSHYLDGYLLDPFGPPLGLALAALSGITLQAAVTFRAERALRGRMEQLLPGPVISRLVDEPNLLRLQGERRQVTALFTDLEGFSSLTNELGPEELISALDRYFSAVSAIVLRNGGMIDKIVGDSVHALFNAPIDQPDHIDAALTAATQIIAETEALRPALGVGRTRIGIESGPVILGDVGSGARIDYTAHGPAVNLAARLQEAGKVLGPAITVGPAAAAGATLSLRPLGEMEVRSFGRLELFTLA